MSYVDHIIEAFGGVRPLATAIGKPSSTVQGWKARGTIPDENKKLVWQRAQTLGVELSPTDFVPFAVSTEPPATAA